MKVFNTLKNLKGAERKIIGGVVSVLLPDMNFGGQKVWKYIDGVLKTLVNFEF